MNAPVINWEASPASLSNPANIVLTLDLSPPPPFFLIIPEEEARIQALTTHYRPAKDILKLFFASLCGEMTMDIVDKYPYLASFQVIGPVPAWLAFRQDKLAFTTAESVINHTDCTLLFTFA